MEVPLNTADWQNMLHSIEDTVQRVAHRHGVAADVLRQQYVMSSIIVTSPFPEYNYSTRQAQAQSSSQNYYGRPGKGYKGKRNGQHNEEVFNYRTTTQSDEFAAQSRLVENTENAGKIYCDIEAALQGEISDPEFDVASTAVGSDEMLIEDQQYMDERTQESEIIEIASRYETQTPLEANIMHKVFVCHVEDKIIYVRILGRHTAAVPDVSNLSVPYMEHLQMGTPVMARANIERNREGSQWYRACVEGVDVDNGAVSVRLVDYGISLPHQSINDLRILPAIHSSPPSTYRIDCSSMEGVCNIGRNTFSGVRVVPIFGKSGSGGWNRTWRATFVQPMAFNAHAVPSGELLFDVGESAEKQSLERQRQEETQSVVQQTTKNTPNREMKGFGPAPDFGHTSPTVPQQGPPTLQQPTQQQQQQQQQNNGGFGSGNGSHKKRKNHGRRGPIRGM